MNTIKFLGQLFPNCVCSVYCYRVPSGFRDFLVICLKYRNPLLVKLLANSRLSDASYFIDEFGSDNLSISKRFKIYTYFRNVSNFSIILVSPLSFYNAFINTVESTFLGSNWAEREIYDIYGVYFYDHSDLRRILTDYGFEGFPLRKDFPVNGYFQIRYDETFKRIVSEPVELTQEYRFFTFKNPWQSGF